MYNDPWSELDDNIAGLLEPAYSSDPDDPVLCDLLDRLRTDRQSMKRCLDDALEELLASLRQPCLTFATTGTTSGGKSALVNLLCGAEIMPVSPEEMSAGVVTIIHGSGRTLTIHNPPEGKSVPWKEECGRWESQSDEAICDRLTRVMRAYNGCRKDVLADRLRPDQLPPCPVSELEYPTFIGDNPELLGLPSICRFRIMDLPGLNYVADESNRRIIGREARKAICLVTYNSEEPSPVLQEQLLEEIVLQVKELGGTPARMLFILNRIDCLRRDSSPETFEEREAVFVRDTEERIRRKLVEHLPEYQSDIVGLRVVRLSTLPALLAHKTRSSLEGVRVMAAQRARRLFAFLVPEELDDELPRRAEKMTEVQARQLADALWKTSYGEEFSARLRGHIGRHFPELVIPQAVDRFKAEAAREVTEWVVQTTSAALNGSSDRYQQECDRINNARQQLRALCDEGERQLRQPFDDIREILKKDTVGDPITKIRERLKLLPGEPLFTGLFARSQSSGAPLLEQGSLDPLYAWRDEMGRAIAQAFEAVASVLEGHRDASAETFARLQAWDVYALNAAYRALEQAGYTSQVAREGQHVETKDAEQRQRLNTILTALHGLAETLNPLMESVMRSAARLEKERIYEATRRLLDAYWQLLTAQARDLVVGISGLASDLGFAAAAATPPPVKVVEQSLSLEYCFSAGFDIQTFYRQEKTGTRLEHYKTKERRWYTLWLYKHEVEKNRYVPVIEPVQYASAHIPDVEGLLTVWMDQAKRQEPELIRQFVDWLVAQVMAASAGLRDSQQRLLDRYQTKLNEAHATADHIFRKEQDDWNALLVKAQKLQECLACLSIGFGLRLMSPLNDVSGIPTEGKNVIIVAAVNNVLHFRIFDGDGAVVVDTDETGLTEQARPIEDLRKLLQSLWPPHELTTSEKGQVITAVTSIVDSILSSPTDRGGTDQ